MLVISEPFTVVATVPFPEMTLTIEAVLAVVDFVPFDARISLSFRDVSLPPGAHLVKLFSSPLAIASEYDLQR
jgi:hypothetical protein